MRGYTLGEVAPLAPLAVPLAELLFWLVALAFCYLCVYIAKAFFGTVSGAVGWIPWLGHVITRPIHDVEHKIVSTMSGAVDAVDAKIGAAFHELARVIDWLGHEIAAHANLLATLAQLLVGSTPLGLAWRLFHTLTARLHGVERQITADIRRIEHIDKRIQHGIGADVLPRLRTLDRELEHVIGRDLPRIRARERELEHGAARTWEWIRTHPFATGSAAFAGAVAWALARLGVTWVRCENWKRAGRQVCGMDPGLLESLLADALLIVGTLSLEEFAREMVGVTDSAVKPITTFWRAN